MDAGLLLASTRLAVAGVLLLAVVAKVRGWTAFVASLSGFRVPSRLAGAGAVALVCAETVTVAAALAPVPDATAGAMVVALAAVFLAAQVFALVAGSDAQCLCFGEFRSEPVSARTVARSALFAAAGVLLVAGARAVPEPADPWAVAGAVLLAVSVWWLLRWAPTGVGRRPSR